MEIDSHIGCAMSGLTADARTMIDHARVTSQNHSFTYDEPIGVESVTQAVCDLALRFGESMDNESAMMVSMAPIYRRLLMYRSCLQSRPFGVALLIAGIDEKGPQLYDLATSSPKATNYSLQGTTPTHREHLPVMKQKLLAVVPKRRRAICKTNIIR